ncbi:hypothetical protein JTB14_026423 [Gonioctena quinquepunctata]|nr:hypothetical protein JTB14_026423 [Gonioctena quinquepunctata]
MSEKKSDSGSDEYIQTFSDKITIRCLDTISFTPFADTQLKFLENPDSISENPSAYSRRGTTSFKDETYESSNYTININNEVVHKRVLPHAGCEYFLDYEEFTHIFVDGILEKAVDVIMNKYQRDVFNPRKYSTVPNIPFWPTIGEFTITDGAEKIKQYIDFTSEVTEDWLYSLKLIVKQSDRVSDFYKYEAKFAIPSKCYPISQATVSVFFTYEVSRVKPPHCPVEVSYQLETCRTIMKPGQNIITEKLLFRVLDAKIAYFKTCSPILQINLKNLFFNKLGNMNNSDEYLRAITNIISIRGMDKISIKQTSEEEMKCITERERKVFRNASGESQIEMEVTQEDSSDDSSLSILDYEGRVIHKRILPEKGCEFFLDYEEFSHIFVDNILDEAVDIVINMHEEEVIVDTPKQSLIRNISTWPAIGDFSVTEGARTLKRYIDFTSEVTEDWLYSLILVAQQSNHVSDFYKYDAKFAIPTKLYPIPQATVSVFFTYEVSRVKPPYCPVEISYQLETCRTIMKPGKNIITEELLFRIIDAKLAYYKQVKF